MRELRISLFFLGVFLSLLIGISSVSAENAMHIGLPDGTQPGEIQVSPGDTFTITIYGSWDTPIAAYEITILFDPDLLTRLRVDFDGTIAVSGGTCYVQDPFLGPLSGG